MDAPDGVGMETPGGHRVDVSDSDRVDALEGDRADASDSNRADVSDGHEILLVEDNPADVTLFRHAFDESNIPGVLHVATTGEEALSRLNDEERRTATEAIDLVVLDLNLPGKSGLEVLSELKNGSSPRALPILILSTSDDEAEIREAYELGANAYLLKGTDFEGTLSVVHALDAFWLNTAELPG